MSDFVVGIAGAIILWLIGSWILQDPSPFKETQEEE